ncbi:MAG: hypothetical protein RLZZ175_1973 [Bacteroidota bacterium]|jgi:hypothetical protein
MKRYILAAFTVIFFTMEAPKKEPTKPVVINITYTESHCTGPKPTEKQQKILDKPKRYPNRKLKVIKGHKHFDAAHSEVVATITTNERGSAKLNLPLGEYSIIDEEKMMIYEHAKANHKDYLIPKDKEVHEWINKPILHFSVTKKKNVVTHNFKKSCYLGENDPSCIVYIGPIVH